MKSKSFFALCKASFCNFSSSHISKIVNFTVSVFLFCLLISCETTGAGKSTDSAQSERDVKATTASVSDDISGTQADNSSQKKTFFTKGELEIFYKAALSDSFLINDKNFMAVADGKKPVFISGDLDKSGIAKLYVLFSESDEGKNLQKEIAGDIRNIYREDQDLRKYILAVYQFRENETKKFARTNNILLDGVGTFVSLKLITIDKSKNIIGISASFMTDTGSQEDIIVLKNRKYIITSISNNLSDTTMKLDIENNGILDLVRYEKVFIDGSGSETFISWYKFNGETFESVKTINIVNDLHLFLENAKQLLESRKTAEFIEISVAPADLKQLKISKIQTDAILSKIFNPVKRQEDNSKNSGEDSLIDINTLINLPGKISFTFPEIHENPFRFDSNAIYNFTTYVRVLLHSDESNIPLDGSEKPAEQASAEEIYLVKIYMPKNPFVEKRYFFFVN